MLQSNGAAEEGLSVSGLVAGSVSTGAAVLLKATHRTLERKGSMNGPVCLP